MIFIDYLKRKKSLNVFVTIFLALIIFYVSSLEFPSGYGVSSFKAVLYHFGIFFLFNFFFMMCVYKYDRFENQFNLFLIVFLLSVFYSILDELHQFFVPGRMCSLEDIFVDLSGILFSFLVHVVYFNYSSKRYAGINYKDL